MEQKSPCYLSFPFPLFPFPYRGQRVPRGTGLNLYWTCSPETPTTRRTRCFALLLISFPDRRWVLSRVGTESEVPVRQVSPSSVGGPLLVATEVLPEVLRLLGTVFPLLPLSSWSVYGAPRTFPVPPLVRKRFGSVTPFLLKMFHPGPTDHMYLSPFLYLNLNNYSCTEVV